MPSPFKRTVAAGIFAAVQLVGGVDIVSASSFTSITQDTNETDVQLVSGDCNYEDILTPYREYSDWQRTLLNTHLMVGKDYKPPDLVSVNSAEIAGRGLVRTIMIDDLRALAQAARKNGTPIAVVSAFRSYDTQKALFARYVRKDGFARAATYSARPGHSEHQLGTTIDFKTKGGSWPGSVPDWAKTPTGRWMYEHAWEFGFIMSYPKNKSDVTCYRYESWHYRYFGRELARQIHESGHTTTEYLKRLNFGN